MARPYPLFGCFVLFALSCFSARIDAAEARGIPGKAGKAAQSAVIDFTALANQPDPAPGVRKDLPAPRRRGIRRVDPLKALKTREQISQYIDVEDGVISAQPRVSKTSAIAAPRSPAPTDNFPALGDNDAATPPDTSSAVGPRHLMVALNTEVRIQDRAGNTISTVTLDQFWAPLGPVVTFNPRINYDAAAGRWVFVALADFFSSTSAIFVGVTDTDDPTGTWRLFRINADDTASGFADYATVGFNKDWIVVSANMFNNLFGFFEQVNLYVIDKASLYAGSGAPFTLLQDPDGEAFTLCPMSTIDPNVSTMYLIEDFSFTNDGQLRICTVTGSVGKESLTLNVAFPQSTEPWDFLGNSAPQLDTAEVVDSGDSRMQSVVYRNGALWCAHTIYLPPNTFEGAAAIQWWQINPNGQVIQRGRIVDPASLVFFGYPSLAVNKNDDVLIGYSRFAANQYISANYAFRRKADPPGTTRTDTVLKAGEAPYRKGFRWGDYSSTVVDPVNDIDLWTTQQYAAAPENGIDRWGTWWGHVIPADTGPSVTATTIDGIAAEVGNNTGLIRLLRSDTQGRLTVNLAVGGTAANGVDYRSIPAFIDFPNGAATVDISVGPLDNPTLDGTRTVAISVAPGPGYSVGNPFGGLVLIDDNETITITSGPTATPNPVQTGLTVVFTVASATQNLSVFWDFGDGTSDETSGLSVSHGFAASGDYTVVCLLEHPTGASVIGSINVTVSDDTDRDGVLDINDPDDDNDGFPDDLEDELGSDSLDPNDTPLDGGNRPTIPLTVEKLSVKLNFANSFKDTLSVSGRLPLTPGFKPENQRAVVSVGGVVLDLDLDKKGSASDGDNSVKLSLKGKPVDGVLMAGFKAAFKQGDFIDALADDGLTDMLALKKVERELPVLVILNQTLYTGRKKILYSAKPGKSGVGR